MILTFTVKVDAEYCDYLRKFDGKVTYNKNSKELRPFIGILFTIYKYEYFAPLSSPKKKHLTMKNTIDFYKINEGKLGAINFNNMIPVMENNYELLKIDKKDCSLKEEKYQRMLKSQLSYLNKYYIEVKNKSKKLYDLYNNNKLPKNIKDRCCNFKMLEEKCRDYNSN